MSVLTKRVYTSRRPSPPQHTTPAWKIIVFVKGKRVTKDVRDPKVGLEKVADLIEQGYKAHLVSKRKAFMPKGDDDLSALNSGKLWCPYCRRWRWFSIPRWLPDVEIGSEDWFLNSYANQEIRCCQWCTISENDWHVRFLNGIGAGEGKRRRRRRRR